MKVLLVNPPAADNVDMIREGRCMQRKGTWGTAWPPLTLSHIGALLQKDKFKVRGIDCISENTSFSQLEKIIQEFQPSLIICNTSTPSIVFDLSVSALAKKVNPKISTAFFGVHVTAKAEECLKEHPEIDFIIRGEPEYTALEITHCVKNKSKKKDIKGISFFDKKIIHNPERQFFRELDKLPFPAWNLFHHKKYVLPDTGNPFFLIMSSRGCPHKCKFCVTHSYYGKTFRQRSSESLIKEMSWSREKYDVSEFIFYSETFTLNKKFVLELCDEIIDSGLKVRWICNSRVDTIDSSMLHKMSKAGCRMIGFGIETASTKILKSMDKKMKKRKIMDAVNMTRRAGISTVGHFMLGFPGETEKDIARTIELSKKLDVDYAQFYTVVPFPGSELYKEVAEKGMIVNKDWRYFEQSHSVLDSGSISPSKIEQMRKKAYRDFYLRPSYLLKTLARIRSLKELRNLAKMSISFLGWVK